MRLSKYLALSVIAAIALQGCAGHEVSKSRVDADYAVKTTKIADAQQTFQPPPVKSLVRHESLPWVASKVVTREKSDRLPQKYDYVTLLFGGRHTIASVAEIIQRTTGLRVMIHPDVMVRPDQLIPRTGGTFTAGNGTGTGAGAGPNPLTSSVSGTPAAVSSVTPPPSPQGTPGNPNQTSSVQATAGGNYYLDVPVNYDGPLADFLDQIATRLGVDWEYRDGRIEIRRFITRNFTIISTPGKAKFASSIGKQGNAASGVGQGGGGGAVGQSTGSFSSDMKVTLDSDVDYWSAVQGALQAMLSPMGKIAINQGSGTVTVTDIRDVVDRIGGFIEEENRTMTRQVSLQIDIYSIRGNDDSEFGVDWELVYNKLSNLSPIWSLGLTSPASLAGTAAGTLGLQVLKNPPTSDTGFVDRTSGSKALFSALATLGKVARVNSQQVMTLNRRAAPVAIVTQQAYAAATQPIAVASGSTATSATYGITPNTVTTGFVLNLVPTITDRSSLLLSFSIDLSELLGITTFTSGSGTSSQSIQLPEVSATQFMQNVGLRSGETLVITGFDRVVSNYDQRTLNRDGSVGLGGSYKGSQTKESLVILVTPVIREGV